MGKTLKALGILGPAIGAMSMTDKAMAGDMGGASLEGIDLATDYVPVVGQIKEALRPEEIGNSELPSEIMEARAKFNEQAKRGMGESSEELEQIEIPEEQTRRFALLNRMR